MTGRVRAVTITRDYLERKVWAVKLLAVFNRKDGTPYWFVTEIRFRDPDRSVVYHEALHYCIKTRVAFIENVKHGQNLTELHKELLAKFDK